MVFSSNKLKINRLASGGLITNYNCLSRCAHCLYNSGPEREKDYIAAETAAECFKAVKSLGCASVHIGGGEPFLNPDGLADVLKAARAVGMGIDYVETNSAWYTDHDRAVGLLLRLRDLGLRTLLISISPFHNERIPLNRVKGVLAACREASMGVFPWIAEFFNEVDAFDDNAPHALAEYETRYGNDYLKKIPSRYWVHFGGRAASTFARVFDLSPLEEVLSRNPGGCRELADVSHFHVDLYGNYVPGLCSGLAIRMEDLGRALPDEDYPLISRLYKEGINGLLQWARESSSFDPQAQYLNKCHLCLDIRKHLNATSTNEYPELAPFGFYQQLEI
jgi:hypothetical protein